MNVKLPRYKCKDNPVLERALNTFADNIEQLLNRKFSAGRGLLYDVEDNNVIFTADEGPNGGKAIIPLYIILGRPKYMSPIDPPVPAEGSKRFCIEWGTINSKVASNWDAYYDLSATTYFFAKVTLNADDDGLSVVSWVVVTGATADAFAVAQWGVDGARPAIDYYLLGFVGVTDGQFAITNSGGGSLTLSEHLTNISDAGGGAVTLQKQFVWLRQNY